MCVYEEYSRETDCFAYANIAETPCKYFIIVKSNNSRALKGLNFISYL